MCRKFMNTIFHLDLFSHNGIQQKWTFLGRHMKEQLNRVVTGSQRLSLLAFKLVVVTWISNSEFVLACWMWTISVTKYSHNSVTAVEAWILTSTRSILRVWRHTAEQNSYISTCAVSRRNFREHFQRNPRRWCRIGKRSISTRCKLETRQAQPNWCQL